jgi:putative DNA primase/helicase
MSSPLPSLLPPSHLTLLLGDPGVGKSLLAIDLAARLSRAQSPLPPLTTDHWPLTPPASTILLSTEDSPDTLILRLFAANADENFIFLPNLTLSLVPPKHTTKPPSLIQGLTKILLEFQNKNLKLLILDSLPSFLGTHDCANAATIRKLLRPLLELAQLHHFAILGLTHLNKSAKSHNPLHRILGSLAYPALARSVLLLSPDPHPQNPHRRILSQLKNNLGSLQPSRAFSIADHPNGPVLEWEPAPLPAAPAPPPLKDPFQNSQFDEALDFLTTTLAAGPLSSAQLLKESRSLGIAPRTLARAKFHLHIHSYRNPNTTEWLTALPS